MKKKTELSLTVIELGVGKQTHEMGAVAWLDMVPLKVQRDVLEGTWVAVNVECAYS